MKVNVNDLFPRKDKGVAQTPYVYDENHSFLLNFITITQTPLINNCYDVDDEALRNFKESINKQRLGHKDPRKGNEMNDIALEAIDATVELPATEAPAIAPDAAAGEAVVFVQDEAFSEDEVR